MKPGAVEQIKMKKAETNDQSRRRFIKQLGLGLATIPLIGLVACGGGSDSTETASTETGSSSGSGSSSGGTTTWATGGTSSMTASFPEDSLFALGTTCTVALTKALTEGPCYFTADTLDDISEEQGGLPMQLCLRVIDNSCNPVSGLEVEVWHTNLEGIYSGDSSGSSDSNGFSTSYCTGNDSEALQSKWFRGTQVTDSNGRVNFKSCFPGWYSGRTIHVHFRVRNNNSDEVVSQLCFPDSFTEQICTTHSEYASRGTQDTTLTEGDGVFGSNYDEFLFDYSQNSDGSLLAYKTMQIS
jgi:protocatechuate 3,4-dioxygenase beta subunit